MALVSYSSYGSLPKNSFSQEQKFFHRLEGIREIPRTIIASSLKGYPWPGLEPVHWGAGVAHNGKLVEKIRW